MNYKYELVKEQEFECPFCKEKILKHITKEGARYHVLHWDNKGEHCSEKRCVINHKCKTERKPK